MTATLLGRLSLLGFLVCAAVNPVRASDKELRDAFRSPPPQSRPWVYWFWLNGNITREGVTADLEAMQRAGIGGVLIMEVDQGSPAGNVKFMSPEWRTLFKHVLTEAHRLGLEVNMNNDAGWEGSGGPWVKPEHSMQKLVWTETTVEGPKRFAGKLPQPEAVAGFYRDVAVLAFPSPGDYRIPDVQRKALAFNDLMHLYTNPTAKPFSDGGDKLPPVSAIQRGRIVNLRDRMDKEGNLAWEAPSGRWTLLRIGHTSTGANNSPAPLSGRGLECDKLDKAALDLHFDAMMGKLVRDAGPLAGTAKTLVSTHIDSWECGAQNWTAKMPEEFKKRRGYDLLPMLPAVSGRVVESLDVSERFLWDLRRTVSELVMENYAGHMRELAHRHGLRLSIEPYVAPCDDLTYSGQADEPMCEFWMNDFAFPSCKGVSSMSHVYGKPITGAETWTAGDNERWLVHPGTMKSLCDRAFCCGVNRFVFHRYAMQPWLGYQPGMTMGPWGVHYERTQTWWEYSLPWHQYVSRCQFLLRQGLFAADVCVLRPEESPQDFPKSSKDRYGAGYDYDYCTAEALLTRVTVRDGRLVLPDGMTYRVLALPEGDRMTPALLAKIRDLVRAGATAVGPRPARSPSLTDYPNCDAELTRLAGELWGDCDGKAVTEHRFGRGKVVCGRTPGEVLAAMGVGPDFYAPRSVSAWLNAIHRTVNDLDIYFVANNRSQPTEAVCNFRVGGKRPELWHPESGRIEAIPVYEEKEGVTSLPVHLDRSGSVFVVFRPNRATDSAGVVSVARNGANVLNAAATPIQVNLAIGAKVSASSTDRGHGYPPYSELLVNDGSNNTTLSTDTSWTNDLGAKMPQWVELDFGATKTVRTVELYTSDGYPLKEFQIQCWDGGRWLDAGPRVTNNTEVHRTITFPPVAASKARVMCYCGPDHQPVFARINEIEVYERAPTPETQAPLAIVANAHGALDIKVWQPGKYELRDFGGKTTSFDVAALPKPLEIGGPWRLKFPPKSGAPENLTLDKLISWSEHGDPGVKHFSGTATYSKSINVPADWVAGEKQIYLDLGEVAVMAEVKLNGKSLGILWKPPYCVNVTDAVKSGENSLEVSVVNLWINRMIGDELLPEDSDRNPDGTLKSWPKWVQEGKPSPTGRHTFTTWRLWKKNDPVQKSGLLGPVTLRAVARRTIGPTGQP